MKLISYNFSFCIYRAGCISITTSLIYARVIAFFIAREKNQKISNLCLLGLV